MFQVFREDLLNDIIKATKWPSFDPLKRVKAGSLWAFMSIVVMFIVGIHIRRGSSGNVDMIQEDRKSVV